MEKLFIPSLYSVSELINIGERILKLLEPFIESDPKIKMQYESVKALYSELVANQKNSPEGPLTDELAEADGDRDQAFRCFKFISMGMSMGLLAENASKALSVYKVLEKYGLDLQRAGYKTETALLISLFEDLDKANYQQDMTDLGILSYYESLKSAQEAFDRLHKQSAEMKTESDKTSRSASEIKLDYIPALQKLTALLRLYAELDSETYEDYFDRMVTYFKEVNATARARQTRKANGKEEIQSSSL